MNLSGIDPTKKSQQAPQVTTRILVAGQVCESIVSGGHILRSVNPLCMKRRPEIQAILLHFCDMPLM